jgi:hypothetical protein
MTPRFRRVAVFVGTAALAAGAGIGVAASGGDASTDAGNRSAPGMSQPLPGGGSGGGGGAAPRGMDISALADALGVSEARLQEALQAARPSGPGGGPDEMIQALADELGIDADKVRAAFEDAFGGNGGPPSGTTSQS